LTSTAKFSIILSQPQCIWMLIGVDFFRVCSNLKNWNTNSYPPKIAL